MEAGQLEDESDFAGETRPHTNLELVNPQEAAFQHAGRRKRALVWREDIDHEAVGQRWVGQTEAQGPVCVRISDSGRKIVRNWYLDPWWPERDWRRLLCPGYSSEYGLAPRA